MTLKVKLILGIIPVPDLKQRLHGDPGHIFQYRGADTPRHIGQNKAVLKGHGHHQHHNRTAAVYGQKGPSHKSSVSQFSGFYGHIGRFKAPPDKAVEIKEKKPLCNSIRVHAHPPARIILLSSIPACAYLYTSASTDSLPFLVSLASPRRENLPKPRTLTVSPVCRLRELFSQSLPPT